MQYQQLKIIRKPEIRVLTGLSTTTQFEQIKSGLLPKYIVLSARSVGLFEHEALAIVSARAAGKSDDEIRAIVKALLKQREQSANDLLKHLAA